MSHLSNLTRKAKTILKSSNRIWSAQTTTTFPTTQFVPQHYIDINEYKDHSHPRIWNQIKKPKEKEKEIIIEPDYKNQKFENLEDAMKWVVKQRNSNNLLYLKHLI